MSANVNLAPFFDTNFAASVYRQGKAGDVFVPGLINELGSFQDNQTSPLGFPERLQWIVNFTAGSTLGTATFVGDPADVKPFHDTLLFDPTTPLLPNQVRYTVASVQIVSAAAGGGGGSGGSGSGGFTNWGNTYDVNADGFVSPIDVLIIINSINNGGGGQLPPGGGEGEAGEKYYVDVNADGFVDPLDVLAVINFLNSDGALAGEGEGEGSSDGLVLRSGELPLVDLPFRGKAIGSSSIYEDVSLYGGTSDEDDSETDLTSLMYSIVEEEDDEYLDSIAADLLSQ